MTEAATQLGVTNHVIRRLIKDRILAAEQVVPDAPYQIRARYLQSEDVTAAIARKHRPCRVDAQGQLPMFTGLQKEVHNERVVTNGFIALSAALLSIGKKPASV